MGKFKRAWSQPSVARTWIPLDAEGDWSTQVERISHATGLPTGGLIISNDYNEDTFYSLFNFHFHSYKGINWLQLNFFFNGQAGRAETDGHFPGKFVMFFWCGVNPPHSQIQRLKLERENVFSSMRHPEEESPVSPQEEYCFYKQVNKGKQDDLQKIQKHQKQNPGLLNSQPNTVCKFSSSSIKELLLSHLSWITTKKSINMDVYRL